MSAFSRITAISLLGASLAIAAPASANLIVNGGFEDPDVAPNSWQAFNPEDVPGWDGSRIEIWDSFNGVTAYEGSQFAELNADPAPNSGPFGIFQNFATTIGQSYDLSFAFQARQSTNEVFSVAVAGTSFNVLNDTLGEWSIYTGSFQATSETTQLLFTSVVPETGTIGNFLDDVTVTASVPEPGTLALMALGLAGLSFRRRK